MCTIIQKYANTGLVNIYQANSNLDGSGVLGTVLTGTAGANGTNVNSITIKATGDTSEGMIRLFTYDGTNYYLWKEVYVPATTATTVVASFQTTIYTSLTLNTGQTLLASTQNSESFNVFADGSDWNNCDCTSDCGCSDSTSVANTGLVNIATANTNRDGTGTIRTLISAPTGTYVNGTEMVTINIKATETTSQGLIGIYIYNGTDYYLIWEVQIPGTTQSNVQPTYRGECFAAITLQAGYAIGVSTQIANSFNVITFANDITNCPCL